MSKQFWGVLIIIVLIFGGIILSNKHKDASTSKSGSTANATSHIRGEGKSGLKLVEYGDYQCPVCGSFFPVTEQVVQKYNTQLFFQFRNLPLTSLHPNAFAAARAAEAAGIQGKYFEMHDELYQNQQTWSSASNPNTYFASYARAIGLDIDKFQKDSDSSKVNDSINADIAAFAKTGDDQATPTYYLNGKKLNNKELIDSKTGPSVDAFSKVIDAAIAKQAAKTADTKK